MPAFLAFFNVLATLAQLLPTIHATITALAPSFPNAAGGLAHATAVTDQVTALVTAAAAATGGVPDEHVTAVNAAVKAAVPLIIASKATYDSFQTQQAPAAVSA